MLFSLRGQLPKRTKLIIELVGSVLFLSLWLLLTEYPIVRPSILPSPLKVISTFGEMHYNDALLRNAGYSFYLNTLGLIEAAVLALPLGLLKIFPIFRSAFERYVTSARFLPLTAVVGLFILWFGIDSNMKVQFLAFSIFLFLLPMVIQRVDEVEEVYVQTVKTLGATKWQTIRTVFIPSVVSRVFDDIRVLAAVSWTYIVVAELVNSSGGGIGALCYIASRMSRVDKVFGILVVIILIGFVQDRSLVYLDKKLFAYKYACDSHGK